MELEVGGPHPSHVHRDSSSMLRRRRWQQHLVKPHPPRQLGKKSLLGALDTIQAFCPVFLYQVGTLEQPPCRVGLQCS